MASTSRVLNDRKTFGYAHQLLRSKRQVESTVDQRFENERDNANEDDQTEPRDVELMGSELYRIAQMGDVNAINDYIRDTEQGVHVGQRGARKQNILHLAAEFKNGNFIKNVLTKGYSYLAMERDENGNLPIHLAAKGCLNAVQVLLEIVTPAQLNGLLTATNEDGNTPLHVALLNGDKDISELLARTEGIAYNPNGAGKTPRYVAAERGYTLVFDLCTKLGDSDGDGWHAIFAAISAKNKGMLRRILETQIIMPIFDQEGQTPLSRASSEGFSSGVRLILDSPYARDYLIWSDKSGSFPIHEAAQKDYLDIVSEFLTRYPDTRNLTNNKGETFLHVAAEKGSERVVRYALRVSGSHDMINRVNKAKESILHKATRAWRPVIVRLLTRDRRIDINRRNSDGRTAFDVAEWSLDRDRPPTLIERMTWDLLNLAKAQRVRGAERPKPFSIPYERQVALYNVLLALAVLVVGSANGALYTIPGGFISSGSPSEGQAVLIHKNQFVAFAFANPFSLLLSMIGSISLVFCFLDDALVREYFGWLSSKLLTASLLSLTISMITGLPTYLDGLAWLQWSIRGFLIFFMIAAIVAHLVLFYPDATSDGMITRGLGHVSLELQLSFYKLRKRYLKKYYKARQGSVVYFE